MGVNIHLVDEQGYHPPEYGWWDYIRHSGDKEFITANLGWTFRRRDDDEPLKRPDMDAAEQWVRANVTPEGNRERLLKLVDFLRGHPEAWLYASW